ncbi:MAG: YHS domain-containing (seleno)protein, partial [Planctomycetota bacterium]
MKTLILIAASALLIALPSRAQQKPGLRNLSPEGLALAGYDPVAYFPAGGAAALEGSAKFESKLGTAHYRFASAEHKAWFEAEPARYEPAYGGFDAASIATGERKPADPKQFRWLGSRLFVFADPALAAGFDSKLAASADEAWLKLSGEKPRGLAGEDARVGVKWNLGKSQLAIEGFDPVSYFPEGGSAPKSGDAKVDTLFEGARYRFAS